MPTVTGVFNSRSEAETAVNQLTSQGFTQSDFSIVMSDKARDQFSWATQDNVKTTTAEQDRERTLEVAAAGGIFGAIVASLTVASGIAFPGIGLLVAGPIATIVTAAGFGTAAGGIAAAVGDEDFSERDLKRYESHLQQGKAVLFVHTNSTEKAAVARNVMQKYTTENMAA